VSTVIEAAAYTAEGARRRHAVQLPADPFDGRVHEAALHHAVRAYMANQRQGTAQTKTRGLVTGGNQKPWRQKGTGRARQGSIRSPLWPGGGTAFGPHPRDYRMGIPKKVRHLALRSAFSARALERAVCVVEPLTFEQPKTKRITALLDRMELGGKRVLILTHGDNRNAILSARNIPDVAVQRYQDANPYEVLRADVVVIEEPALGPLVEGADLGEAPARRVREPKAAEPVAVEGEAEAGPKQKTTAKQAKAAAPKKAAAKKPAAKKPAAKKPAAKKQAAKSGKGAAAEKAKKPSRKKE
jgi:large subunit ribosomal protein L4